MYGHVLHYIVSSIYTSFIVLTFNSIQKQYLEMINKNRRRKQKKLQSLAPVMSFCGMRVILICCLLIFASSMILFVLLFVLRKDAKEHEVSAEFLVGSLAVTGR